MRPALAESWRQRSFAPARRLCQELVSRGTIPDGALLHAIPRLSFARTLWHALIGECLIFGAAAMPRLPLALNVLRCFLAPERIGADATERATFAPIEQVYLGVHDLRFAGGCYRPEHVGYNDLDDIGRLLQYLRSVQPDAWTPVPLAGSPELADEAEREEELAYLRDWWPALVAMYAGAHAAQQVIVCERP